MHALGRRRFIDIAVNLTDCVFVGVCRKGKRIHDSDLDLVVARAIAAGVERMIITGTTLDVSRRIVSRARERALHRRHPPRPFGRVSRRRDEATARGGGGRRVARCEEEGPDAAGRHEESNGGGRADWCRGFAGDDNNTK